MDCQINLHCIQTLCFNPGNVHSYMPGYECRYVQNCYHLPKKDRFHLCHQNSSDPWAMKSRTALKLCCVI